MHWPRGVAPSPRQPMARKCYLVRRHAIPHQQLRGPVAHDYRLIHLAHQGSKSRVSKLYQLSHPQGGPWAAGPAEHANQLAHVRGQPAEQGAGGLPRAQAVERAAGARMEIESPVTHDGPPAQERPAHARDGWRVIGKYDGNSTPLRFAHHSHRHAAGERVEMDNVWGLVVEDAGKFAAGLCVALTIQVTQVSQPGAGGEPAHAQAAFRIAQRFLAGGGNQHVEPTRLLLTCQRIDIYLGAADGIGREAKWNVDNLHFVRAGALLTTDLASSYGLRPTTVASNRRITAGWTR